MHVDVTRDEIDALIDCVEAVERAPGHLWRLDSARVARACVARLIERRDAWQRVATPETIPTASEGEE